MSNMQTVESHVLAAFQNIAPEHRQTLFDARELIFTVASSDPRIGEVEEILRWGEPAYITAKQKTGSTSHLSPKLSHCIAAALSYHLRT